MKDSAQDFQHVRKHDSRNTKPTSLVGLLARLVAISRSLVGSFTCLPACLQGGIVWKCTLKVTHFPELPLR